MAISLFDIFTIGIGPSSSHTVGPMRAALRFLKKLKGQSKWNHVSKIKVELYGSLGLTGKAHGSDKAILLGLEGEKPEDVDPDLLDNILSQVKTSKKISLNGEKDIPFDEKKDLVFYRNKNLPLHPNGMSFTALDQSKTELLKKTYYSVGGGFIVEEGVQKDSSLSADYTQVPYPFKMAEDLLKLGINHRKKFYQIILENEKAWHSEQEIRDYILKVWDAMQACIQRGFEQTGILPGGLKVERRAPKIYHKLISKPEQSLKDPLTIMDWVDLYAISVNEENAAGGRVVTAPTNGAAGVIPAVLTYYTNLFSEASDDNIIEFFLTAGAIAILYKENASISGAEVGCQGEVGVACSMAAAGLAAVMGGTNEQIENAAEIGMEHNLGLTCDPVGGLVQIPCIERNAMGAIKAINAARLALKGEGVHKISLDKVIKTMRETGKDMQSKYKETSRGGLAINYVEC